MSMWRGIKTLLFSNRTTRQTVLKNTVWLTVGQVGGRLLRAMVIIAAARVLGADAWGAFSYALAIITFLTIFTDLGIGSIITRDAARAGDAAERSRIVSTTFAIKLALLAAGVLVVLLAVPRFATIPAARSLFPIVVFILVFDTLREFGFAFTRAVEKMELEAYLNVATNVAIVVAGFTALALTPSAKSFAIAYAVGTGIGSVATFLVLRRDFRRLLADFSRRLVLPILNAAWPFALATFLGSLMVNTDILLIGALRPAADVGYYAAGLRIIQLLYLLPTLLAVSTLPAFARLARGPEERMRIALERTVSVMYLAALPAAVGGVILGSSIVGAVFGAVYLPAALSFQILALTILIDFPVTALSNALFAYEAQKKLVVYAAIGVISNIVFDLLLIPPFGIAGSAAATFAAQLLSNIYLWHALRRVIDFNILRHLKKMIPAALLMGAVALAGTMAGVNVFMNVILCAAVYLGLLYKFREPLLKETMELISKPAFVAK
jgi:O-antigen/teichoic acid export membrane protein